MQQLLPDSAKTVLKCKSRIFLAHMTASFFPLEHSTKEPNWQSNRSSSSPLHLIWSSAKKCPDLPISSVSKQQLSWVNQFNSFWANYRKCQAGLLWQKDSLEFGTLLQSLFDLCCCHRRKLALTGSGWRGNLDENSFYLGNPRFNSSYIPMVTVLSSIVFDKSSCIWSDFGNPRLQSTAATEPLGQSWENIGTILGHGIQSVYLLSCASHNLICVRHFHDTLLWPDDLLLEN